jgi:hypothetical protein
VRVLREDATLERVALPTAHGAYVERIIGLCVRRLLQLAPIDQLDVGHCRPRRFPGVLVLEPAAQRGQNLRPIIVEREA